MTSYELARILLGIAGVLIVVLGAIIAYVICVERRLSRDDVRLEELYTYLKHNIPDMISEILELHREVTRLAAHVGLSPAAHKQSEYRRARLEDAREAITETLRVREDCAK